MKTFVLTGGIGAGKSAVLSRFVERGVVAIDADQVVSSLQQPGQLVFEQIAQRFGTSVIDHSGGLDRGALADLVFGEPEQLKALEAIVHPAVRSQISTKLEELRNSAESENRIVVIDIPLVVDRDSLYDADGLVVVDCPVEIVLERLAKSRGMSRAEAQQRVNSQISRQERCELADFVIDNSGPLAALEQEVARCWEWMNGRNSR